MTVKTTKDLEKYAKEMLPTTVYLSINLDRNIKPFAPAGEKYTLVFRSNYTSAGHANNIQDAKDMIDDFLARN